VEVKIMKMHLKVVGLRGEGEYENFGEEVPKLAKQLLSRLSEIEGQVGDEVAIYEAKKDENHQVGHYLVGVIVTDTLRQIPEGMESIEVDERYVTLRGKISVIDSLHKDVISWIDEQGYTRNLNSQIVETYHPVEGEEEVQIYLPIY